MSLPVTNILVPIDFTEQSFIGLEQAQILAKASGAEITLVHIIKESGPIWNLFSDKEKNDIIDKIKTKLLNFANLLANNEQLKFNTIVERGYIVEKILEIEERIHCSFIVMGTTSADNIRKKIIGSNALNIVHEAKCPVITIKGKLYRDECKNIIVPLDLKKNTKEKVSDAINIAKLFNAKISIVSVIGIDDEFIENKLQNQLKTVEKFIEQQKISTTCKLLKLGECGDSYADCLKKYSLVNEGDLMVITTQDQTPIIDYFIGSFAKEMIHGLDIPVMSITPKINRHLIFHPY
ncbi:MAG: universal stress protein [Chlorobi bacterium]|nr:universal stress protein [Chlorobiota bacterium]